jgi:hypothetical protein
VKLVKVVFYTLIEKLNGKPQRKNSKRSRLE